jgi:DNA-binding GntR family transcriptional regulator
MRKRPDGQKKSAPAPLAASIGANETGSAGGIGDATGLAETTGRVSVDSMPFDFPPALSQSPGPIAARIVDTMKQAIITMRIRPGERLSEQELAAGFGVSRQPVREALIKLAEAGLVLILPQRGTLVVKISRAAVENARFIREAIECAVVREAAKRQDTDVFEAIRRNLAETERCIALGETDHFFRLDEAFHAHLAAAAGRPDTWHVIEEQKSQMDRVRYLDVSAGVPMQVLLDQHRAIYEAVAAGDGEAAERVMHQHLTEILKVLPQLAVAWPDLFED